MESARSVLADELQEGLTPGFNYFAFVLVSVLVAIVGLLLLAQLLLLTATGGMTPWD